MDLKCLSRSDLLILLDIVHDAVQCRTHDDYLQLIEKLKQLLSFAQSRSVFGDRRDYSLRKMDGFTMLTHFPEEWEIRYNEQDYFLCDKVAQTSFYHAGLFNWQECLLPQAMQECCAKQSQRVMDEASAFGLHEGWVYSTQCRRSTEWSVISVAGEHCSKSKRTKSILYHLLPHLCVALQNVATLQPGASVQLSAREYEVLSWIASGKTAWETSEILHISRRTVEFHMANILKKFDAINSQQAIALAVSQGLIRYG